MHYPQDPALSGVAVIRISGEKTKDVVQSIIIGFFSKTKSCLFEKNNKFKISERTN